MEFKKYSEIDNSYQKKIINQIYENGFGNNDIEYVVTEKVDGANFSVTIDENNKCYYAKRTQFLEYDDTFYSYEYMLAREHLEEKARKIKEILNIDALTIYGELAGGKYIHPDVKSEKISAVQARIQYAPFLFFYAFDIVIVKDEQRKYLNENEFDQLCKEVNLTRSIVIYKGTFKECLEISPEFESKVPSMFNLPPIENNIAEGVVIKPIYPLWFNNGSRVIIKNKNQKFAEKMKCKTGKREKFQKASMTDIEINIFNKLLEYRTESRLYSVLSKIGNITNKDFGKILGLFIQDLLNDFNKENLEEVKILQEQNDINQFNFKKIMKKLQENIKDWIRPFFIDNIS